MKLGTLSALVIGFLTLVIAAGAQAPTVNSAATSESVQVPRLIMFSGIAKDETGKPVSGAVGITFSLYKEEEGGTPLWIEIQNLQADAAGHYTALSRA